MYEIPFTQFLLPNGRRRQVQFQTESKEVADTALQLIEQGVSFEIEILRTGEISMETIYEDEPVANDLCSNGPAVVEAVEKLVRRTNEAINGNA